MKVLTQTDIRYIAEHAKEEKKSINEYLEDIGFDAGSNRSRGKAPLLLDGIPAGVAEPLLISEKNLLII